MLDGLSHQEASKKHFPLPKLVIGDFGTDRGGAFMYHPSDKPDPEISGWESRRQSYFCPISCLTGLCRKVPVLCPVPGTCRSGFSRTMF